MMQTMLSLNMPSKCGHLLIIGHFDIQISSLSVKQKPKKALALASRRLVYGGVKTFMF